LKNFDEKIRDKLYDAEMPVSDHLWNYIDSQISNKKERPKYWLFFLVSLILLPGFYLGYKSLSNKVNHQKELAKLDSSQEIMGDINNIINNSNQIIVENLKHTPVSKISKLDMPFVSQKKIKKQNLSFQIITNKNSLTRTSNRHQSSLNYSILNNIEKLPIIKNELLSNSIESDYVDFKGEISGIPQCPSFSGKQNNFYIYSNLGVNYPFQFLSSNTFSFDAGLGYQLNDNLFLQAGLSYNQINVKFQLIEEGKSRNQTITIIDTIFGTNGEIIDIEMNTFINQESGTKETVVLNKHKQFDLPISLGYRLPISRRFNFMISGGLALNLRTNSSGLILDSNNKPIDIAENNLDRNLFSTKVGISYTGAFKFETEILNDLYINAGIDLRYYSGAFNSNENPIDQKYLSVGLGTGMRYKF